MVFAPSLFTSVTVSCLPSSRREGLFTARFRPTYLIFPRDRVGLSTVACASPRSTDSTASKTEKKEQSPPEEDTEDDSDFDYDYEEMDDATFEALFKDIRNDPSFMKDYDSEITEEDFVLVQRALSQAMRDGGDDDDDDDDDVIDLSSSPVDNIGSDEEVKNLGTSV